MTADDWFSRLQSDSVTPRDYLEFRKWLHAKPENMRDHEDLTLIWTIAGDLENDLDVQQALRECVRAETSEARRAQITAGLWKSRRALVPIFMVLIAIGVLFLLKLDLPHIYRTTTGEQRTIVLSDGSSATLNTDTLLSVKYTNKCRCINVSRGEVLFSVAHGSPRPFRVSAADDVVQATGTRFDVLIKEDQLSIAVLEGTIKVSTGRAEGASVKLNSKLTAGQAATLHGSTLIAQNADADIRRINAWRVGRLEFRQRRLIDVVHEFGRYTDYKFIIADGNLKNLRFSGVFRIGDVKAFLSALNGLGLRSIQEPDGNILILKSNGLQASPDGKGRTKVST